MTERSYSLRIVDGLRAEPGHPAECWPTREAARDAALSIAHRMSREGIRWVTIRREYGGALGPLPVWRCYPDGAELDLGDED